MMKDIECEQLQQQLLDQRTTIANMIDRNNNLLRHIKQDVLNIDVYDNGKLVSDGYYGDYSPIHIHSHYHSVGIKEKSASHIIADVVNIINEYIIEQKGETN
jgi:hypothetical protein